MSSSCPYCGAALKFKFCVVCGRQNKLNKMGSIRNTARNTDETIQLDNPLMEEEEGVSKSLRFYKKISPTIIGVIFACILIFCAAREAWNFYSSHYLNNTVAPWMNSHRFTVNKKSLNKSMHQTTHSKSSRTQQNH